MVVNFFISSCSLAYTQTNANHGYSHRFLSYIDVYIFSTWLSFQFQASCYTYCIWNNYYFPNMLAVRFYLYHDNNRYALHSVEQVFELSVYIRNNVWVNAKISLIIFINFFAILRARFNYYGLQIQTKCCFFKARQNNKLFFPLFKLLSQTQIGSVIWLIAVVIKFYHFSATEYGLPPMGMDIREHWHSDECSAWLKPIW